jgi:hypothetical protein
MSYLDFMHAAQAPEDAKEAARKLAEAKQAEIEPESDEHEGEDQPIRRGPGRPKKQP